VRSADDDAGACPVAEVERLLSRWPGRTGPRCSARNPIMGANLCPNADP